MGFFAGDSIGRYYRYKSRDTGHSALAWQATMGHFEMAVNTMTAFSDSSHCQV